MSRQSDLETLIHGELRRVFSAQPLYATPEDLTLFHRQFAAVVFGLAIANRDSDLLQRGRGAQAFSIAQEVFSRYEVYTLDPLDHHNYLYTEKFVRDIAAGHTLTFSVNQDALPPSLRDAPA